jgi:hypothetical protein
VVRNIRGQAVGSSLSWFYSGFSWWLLLAFRSGKAIRRQYRHALSKIANRLLQRYSPFALEARSSSWIYYIPIWFQAVQGVSAVESGIRNLPFLLGVTIMTIISGAMITSLGWHTPWAFFCTVFMAVGAGLMMTFKVDTGLGKWFGYQVIYGFGAGAGFQQPVVAVQSILKPEDVPVGTTIILFIQLFGGAVFASVATNIFNNHLVTNLMKEVPGVDVQTVINAGATPESCCGS